MPTVKDFKEYIKREFPDDQEVIAYDIWVIGDVQDQAENNEVHISKEQAKEVLEFVQHRKDATIGINWDVLDYAIGEVLRGEK